nr:hypothetical protein [Tanacetum cinerariifolium]
MVLWVSVVERSGGRGVTTVEEMDGGDGVTVRMERYGSGVTVGIYQWRGHVFVYFVCLWIYTNVTGLDLMLLNGLLQKFKWTELLRN